MMKETSKKTLYTVTECAVLIALGIALSYIKIPIGAFGGSVDFVMVPLFVLWELFCIGLVFRKTTK